MPPHSADSTLVGQRFGRLLVISDAGSTGKGWAWNCLCDCGRIVQLMQFKLKAGYNRSCGCLIRQRRRSENITGVRFGRLTAITRFHARPDGKAEWVCRCNCGNYAVVLATRLRRGYIRSCGCLGRDTTAQRNRKHGLAKSPEHVIWLAIKQRCFNSNCQAYSYYGGRGITMCERWSKSFAAFLEDMGPRPSRYHEIDRINNNGNYEPDNCRWATRIDQANNKRNSVFLVFNGRRQTAIQWSRELGISRSTIDNRRRKGWPDEQVLATPIDNGRGKGRKCPSRRNI